MNWKLFTTTCVSVALLAFPQNAFTCADGEDPYDYYTSFFNNTLGTGKEYRPFYYTSLLKFYDDYNPDTTAVEDDAVLKEWRTYGKSQRLQDAAELVYKTSLADAAQLAKAAAGTAALPASLKGNSLAENLIKEKKTEALNYLQFAKRTASVVPVSAWEEAPKRDSGQINKWLNEAEALYAKTTESFLKNKYAFQRCKISFYNNRYQDCIRYCDDAFTETSPEAVAPLALSYKAGSLFRTGRNKEAAYLFSKLFAQSSQNKKQNYLGFWWSTNYANSTLADDCLSLCKTNAERANLIGLFALYGTAYSLQALQSVYKLDPASPLLPLLATREISKLEEQYLTPLLNSEAGGTVLYPNWRSDALEEKTSGAGKQQAAKTATFFETLAAASPANRNLYGTGAAYLRYMTKDYEAAKSLLAKYKGGDAKLADENQLLQLLIAASEAKTISREREAQLLPAMRWLVQKAKADENYRLFSRNFFSQVLARKYGQQADTARAVVAYGIADVSGAQFPANEDWMAYSNAVNYLRHGMSTQALLKLYNLEINPQSETDKFFVQNTAVKRDAVIDVLGTSYLRDRAYAKAIDWLGKAGTQKPLVETQYNYETGKEKTVNPDPLHDYLNDWQRYNKSVAVPYTKLTLAKKLLELQNKIARIDTVTNKAKLYYTYASALYNLSHYGNSWEAVAYDRSGSNWNTGDYKTTWEKEFFGVYEARNYYQKAYEAATDKEYKAACLFMVIKCAQRQIPVPQYDYKNEGTSKKAAKEFERRFKYNPLFAKFKTEFGGTKFYQYAYNRCSYLRDFVSRSSTPTKPQPAQGKRG